MDTRMEQLKQETRALAQTNAKFRDFIQAQDHILRIPSDITNPLKRTSQEIALLHAQAQQMDSMQVALDEDTRAFKRSKADSRATFCKSFPCRYVILGFPHVHYMRVCVSLITKVNLRKRFVTKMKASPALSEFANALESKH